MSSNLDMGIGGVGTTALDRGTYQYNDPSLGAPYHDLSGRMMDATSAAQFLMGSVMSHWPFDSTLCSCGAFPGGCSCEDHTIAPPDIMGPEFQSTETSQPRGDHGQATITVEPHGPPQKAQRPKKRRRTSKSSKSSKSSVKKGKNVSFPPTARKQDAQNRQKSMIHQFNELDDNDIDKAIFFDNDEDDGQGGGSTSDKLLERNRLAASKCRQKKKKRFDELEKVKSDLETQHNHLHIQYDELRIEVNQLKNHLIKHAGCKDDNIDRWIGSKAQNFVDKTTLA